MFAPRHTPDAGDDVIVKLAADREAANMPDLARECARFGWEAAANALDGLPGGDLARRDAGGRFWFVGRGDDLIKSAGHLIGPFEVESALMEHPAVAEAGEADAGANLFDEFDIDSIDFLTLVTRLSERFGTPMPEADYPRMRSVDALVDYLGEVRS